MPAKRVSMRKIKECLRLKWACGLSHEQIARALGLSKGVVTKYLQRAAQVGLTEDQAATLSEVALEARLQPAGKRPRASECRRTCPGCIGSYAVTA